MKHGNTYYLELGRSIFNEHAYDELPMYSRWIFTVMNELEQKYTGKKEDYFFRSDEDLAKDCGLSIRTVQRYKKPLIDLKYIQHWNTHFIDKDGKKSEKKISAYRILK